MLNIGFVAALALGLFALIAWGVRTLPAERWQMLAAVPIAKVGRWLVARPESDVLRLLQRDRNGFGFAMMLLLLGSVGIPVASVLLLVVFVIAGLRALLRD